MQGVMRHCNHLQLCFPKQHSAAGTQSKSARRSAAVATSVVQILGRCWHPDPHLLDGSSPLNPLRLAGRHNARAASASGGWGLTLSEAVVTSSVAAALPQGLTYIHLRCVTGAQRTAWENNACSPKPRFANLLLSFTAAEHAAGCCCCSPSIQTIEASHLGAGTSPMMWHQAILVYLRTRLPLGAHPGRLLLLESSGVAMSP
jgi:hypothetical protein